ncbi:hypothetical protein ACFPRL_29585 [Pseudoclavibacter helvolus]
MHPHGGAGFGHLGGDLHSELLSRLRKHHDIRADLDCEFRDGRRARGIASCVPAQDVNALRRVCHRHWGAEPPVDEQGGRRSDEDRDDQRRHPEDGPCLARGKDRDEEQQHDRRRANRYREPERDGLRDKRCSLQVEQLRPAEDDRRGERDEPKQDPRYSVTGNGGSSGWWRSTRHDGLSVAPGISRLWEAHGVELSAPCALIGA